MTWTRDKITTTRIDALIREAVEARRSLFLWDTKVDGFGCRISPKGKVSWLTQRWQKARGRNGAPERKVFDQYPATGVDQARKQARAILGVGEEPAKPKDTTLGNAVETYFARRSKPGRTWKELRQRFDNHVIPELGKHTLLSRITKADLDTLVEAKRREHPVAARTLYEALRPFFKWCASLELIAKSPLDGLPIPDAPTSRDRILTDDEIKAFWRATLEDELFGPFYRLLLLTAQRREEVGAMRWSEIDGALWTIPGSRTKNSETHIVPLSSGALDVLRMVPTQHASGYVFTATLETPISGYSKAKARLDNLMGAAPPWRVHDLRRTAASGMGSLRIPPHVIEAVLNHKSGTIKGVARVYNRYEYLEEKRHALEAWGNYVSQLIGVSPEKTNVIAIRR